MATQVFLSHSSQDDRYVAEFESFVRAFLREFAKDQEADVFNDVRSIEAGEEFWPAIETGITECRIFVIIVSAAAVASKWVRDEVALARKLKKRIIPVRIDPCDASALFDGRDLVDFRPGRGNKLHYNTKSLPATYTGKLYGREVEMAQLFADLENPQVRLVAFDAMGGTGKTALIYHFIQQLKTEGWRKLESVFIWSFYSQGSSEDKQSHAADFFKAAYAHFHPQGKEAPIPEDPREQGAVLAKLVAEQPALLVLDGLEPLQYAASGSGSAYPFGGIKDPGVKTLLAHLADLGTGLTIVTTRIKVHELEGNASFLRHHLDQLPTNAAIELLRDFGIEKKAFPGELPPAVREEFVQAIQDLRHHALSLNLAARLVAQHHEGQIRAFAEVLPTLHDAADQDIHENHRSPFRVMRALEAGLYRLLHNRLQRMSAAEAIETSPAANQLCLLYFLGLFDQPASLELLPVVYDASQDLRDAVSMLPADKAEYLQKVADAAAARDAVLQEPRSTDGARKEALHAFEERFYGLSFHYWLPPVFAKFDPRPRSDNRSVTNALTQLSEQGLVSKARLKEVEGGHVAWETLPDGKWFQHHVDCHPLIREYFGHQLRTRYEPAFRAAHGRLYDHFRFAGLPEEFRDPVAYAFLALDVAYPNDPDFSLDSLMRGQDYPVHLRGYLTPPLLKLLDGSSESVHRLTVADSLRKSANTRAALQRFLPPTEAAMTPLFAAIGHGCLAGRQHNVFYEVYWPRIARGNENFACNKLGLFGQELAAVASFFEKPFQISSSGLQPSDQALVLNLAGFRLRAIGRLPDALEPFRAAVQAYAGLGDFRNAAQDAGNLSELLLTLGHLERDEAGQPGARPGAEQAVAYAEQSGDLFMRLTARASWHGNALLAAGRLREAEERFREAEALQCQCQPGLPRLYSTGGFVYGELLLARGRAEEVAERAEYLVSVRQDGDSILDRALEELNQARAQSRLASQRGTRNQEPGTSSPFLKALLEANQEAYVVPGYLAEAEILLCASASLREVEAALTEAETRAKRGPMPLFLADTYLLRARLALSVAKGLRPSGRERVESRPTSPKTEAPSLPGNPLSQAKAFRGQAAELIRKHGYGRRVPDLAVLDCELDPCLENFQTACAKVGEEGWWELLPRLEALAAARPEGGWFKKGDRCQWERILAPLRKGEREYQRERDAYLSNQSSAGSIQPEEGADGDGLLAQLPAELIQQIATQTGAPADWRQWPPELNAAVVEAIRKSQSS